MRTYYQAARISKQGFHQYLNRKMLLREECEQLIPVIQQIRKEYPTLSAREMYHIIGPERLGRDRFEQFCFEEGFKVERKKTFYKTTNSLGVTRFPNRIKDIELNGINQVWVSDITYYRIRERFYFLTFITDKFSRKIIGYSISKNLLTENTTIPALKMAFKDRQGKRPNIFHSDGGGQYYSKDFRLLTGSDILNSMGECAYENPLAERINGQIKNDYLSHYAPSNFEELITQTSRAVYNYNFKRHSSFKMSPNELESLLTNEQLLTKEKKNQKKKSIQQITTFIKPSKLVNLIQA